MRDADSTPEAFDLTDPMPRPSGSQQTPLDMQVERAGLAEQLFGVALEAPRIGRFRVLERLGAGGMGEVYAAFDQKLDRRVAIKVLRAAADGSENHARLLREAQAMARLSHPNVVQVYEVGDHGGQIFIAMEFVKGCTLRQWLAREPRPWQEVLAVFEQAGRGLFAAHTAGVVHRDFKPDNVLVGDDQRVRVVDFGLAHGELGTGPVAADDSATVPYVDALALPLTERGAVIGTPAFMSPEQHDGAPTDPRTDQFSFCVALYDALYGRRPFTGATLFELAEAVHTGVVPEPPAGSPVPEYIHRALVTGLAPDPGHRHPSMEVLLAELSRDAPGARDPWRLVALALALALLAGAIVFGLLGRERAATAEELAAVAALAHEARDAAARAHWVYPAPVDPRDTAILRIVALEALDGPVEARALAEAATLRAAMADELAALGDTYWSIARPYARDFYAQALVFRPDDPRAHERGGLTPGELAELRDKALHGGFTVHELTAVEPLLVLASSDPAERARWLHAHEQRAALGLPEEPGQTPPEPAAPTSPSDHVSTAMPHETAMPPASDPARTRPSTRPTTKSPPPPPPPPAPEPAPEPDPAPAAADPARSGQLVTDADAARRRGARDEAIKLFHRALAADPKNSAALIGLSDLAFDEGEYERAVDFAERAVKLAARHGSYRLRLGDALYKVMRFTDARREYETAAELGHPRARERLDRLRDKLGDP